MTAERERSAGISTATGTAFQGGYGARGEIVAAPPASIKKIRTMLVTRIFTSGDYRRGPAVSCQLGLITAISRMRVVSSDRRWLSVGVFLWLAPALGLQAQVPPTSPSASEVSIQIVDSADTPLVAAEVTLRGEKGRSLGTRTDSSGFATFKAIAEGPWVMTVRRLGIKPLTVPLHISGGQNRFTVQTDRLMSTLEGVRIVGERTYSARLDDFERRRRAGLPNATVTRAEIERRAPVNLSRMLRGMPGVQIGDSLGNAVAISTRGAKPVRAPAGKIGFGLVPCVMRMSLDGVLLPGLANIDGIVPNDVHGIEVYFGPARMPPELAGLRTDNWCGLVAIWTRDR